ncbi:MAG: B-box zinc finger protein [Acidimicrobiales bacterium]
MSASTTLVCPRHKVETPLTCVTCETPICPQCYVRTAVGLRCPKCAEGVTVKLGGRRRWPILVAALVAVAVAAVVLVSMGSGGDDPPADNVATGGGQATSNTRVVSRPELGYSVEVPFQWQQAADHTDTTLSYVAQRGAAGSLRVTVERGEGVLDEVVARLVRQLTAQGGQDFVQTATQLTGIPAIRLAYRFPISTTPGSGLATRTSYLAVNKGNLYSFQLASTDPGATESVFAAMATKFTLL